MRVRPPCEESSRQKKEKKKRKKKEACVCVCVCVYPNREAGKKRKRVAVRHGFMPLRQSVMEGGCHSGQGGKQSEPQRNSEP